MKSHILRHGSILAEKCPHSPSQPPARSELAWCATMDRSVPAKTDKVKKDKKAKKVKKAKKAKKAKRSRPGDAAASAAAADASAATVACELPSPKKRRRTGRDTSSAGASTNASTAAAATKKPNKPVTKKKKAKPPVEVVEFVAPGARRAAAREKIREEIRRRGGDADEANAGAGGGVDLSSRRAFYSVYREVQDFGSCGGCSCDGLGVCWLISPPCCGTDLLLNRCHGPGCAKPEGVRSQARRGVGRRCTMRNRAGCCCAAVSHACYALLARQSSHHIKMPIKMLLGVRKARVKREEKQREMVCGLAACGQWCLVLTQWVCCIAGATVRSHHWQEVCQQELQVPRPTTQAVQLAQGHRWCQQPGGAAHEERRPVRQERHVVRGAGVMSMIKHCTALHCVA